MTSLLRKELRQLRPIVLFWMAISVLSFFEILLSNRIDEYLFSTWCGPLCEPGTASDHAIVLLIIALVLAYSLFPNEHAQSTIDFLYALPVSRANIFLAKLAAGFLVLVLIVMVDYTLSALLLWANPQSLEGRFYPQFFATLLLSELLFMSVILCHGILISWFRFVGLILYAVYLVALSVQESVVGQLHAVSVFSMLTVNIEGQSLQLARMNIVIHLCIAVIFLYSAYRLWSRDHDVTEVKKVKRLGRWFVISGTVLMFILAAGLMSFQSYREAALPSGQNRSSALTTVSTEHYRFIAHKRSDGPLNYITRHADQDYQALIALLGIDKQPLIQADMTSRSDHALGVASWKKVRLNLTSFSTEQQYRRVLSHETTHVFQSIESDRKLRKYFNAAKFFIEGMAQYTSFHIVPDGGLRGSNWRLAAIAWNRQAIQFSDIIDYKQFEMQYDEELVYTLGDIWVQAMVDTCTETVLGDILRVFANNAPSPSFPPYELWRHVLSSAGCQLEDVVDQWSELLDTTLAPMDQLQFPEYETPVISIVEGSNRLRIRAALAVDPQQQPESFQIKIRHDAQFGVTRHARYSGQLIDSVGSTEVEFVVPRSVAVQGPIRYQLGYVPVKGNRIYFTKWRRGSASQALN